ncbi:MAG: hypothetical protein MUD08_05210 [Cytophagales bacterium]|nr:hypothetical protein [Cytophagales bacterium]
MILKCAVLVLLLAACGSRTNQYKPEQHLKPEAQQAFLYQISRYVAKLPKGVYHEGKFDARFDRYYREEMKKYRLESYFKSPDGTVHFMVSRPAPSLYEKRIAIGGSVKYDTNGGLTAYEEVFRTWKMKPDVLAQKGGVLFETMVETGNVEAYLPQNTQEEWVEFPDSRTYFDVAARRWKVKGQNDSLNYHTF